MSRPKAPRHLSAEMRRFWGRILADFELGDDALVILRTACEQFDLAQRARVEIERDGITLNGRRHPATDVQKTATGLFLRALRQLGLDVEAPGQVGRPAGWQ